MGKESEAEVYVRVAKWLNTEEGRKAVHEEVEQIKEEEFQKQAAAERAREIPLISY